jgi:hypothetical protein
MEQRITRSTCAGGVLNSGEHDCAFPVAGVLGLSLGKLYGLPGKLPRGLDREEEDRGMVRPRWLSSGGSGGSQRGRRSYGRAPGSLARVKGCNGEDSRALGWAL